MHFQLTYSTNSEDMGPVRSKWACLAWHALENSLVFVEATQIKYNLYVLSKTNKSCING